MYYLIAGSNTSMRNIIPRLAASVLFIACTTTGSSQSFSSVDIVRINAQFEKEAMYFYRENWQAFRKSAFDKGFISGYEMLRSDTDSTNHFQFILITEYPDKASFDKREEHFAPIMKSISPNGPKMLNKVDRKVFLEYLNGYDTQPVVSSRKKTDK
jgi:hypothetical protein